MPVGVDPDMVIGPAYVVGNGGATDERGFDVAVDRQLVVGVTYQVTVRNLQSLAGGSLGTPSSADFPGVTQLHETKLPQRNQDLVDFANPPALGHWVFDKNEDIAPESAGRGDPQAGLPPRLHEEGRLRLSARLRSGARSQGRRQPGEARHLPGRLSEPDPAGARRGVRQRSTSIQATGVAIIQVNAKTIRGTFVDRAAR